MLMEVGTRVFGLPKSSMDHFVVLRAAPFKLRVSGQIVSAAPGKYIARSSYNKHTAAQLSQVNGKENATLPVENNTQDLERRKTGSIYGETKRAPWYRELAMASVNDTLLVFHHRSDKIVFRGVVRPLRIVCFPQATDGAHHDTTAVPTSPHQRGSNSYPNIVFSLYGVEGVWHGIDYQVHRIVYSCRFSACSLSQPVKTPLK